MDDFKDDNVVNQVKHLYTENSKKAQINFEHVNILSEFDNFKIEDDPITNEMKDKIYHEFSQLIQQHSSLLNRLEYFMEEYGPYFAHFIVIQSDLLPGILQSILADPQGLAFMQLTQMITISHDAILNSFQHGIFFFIRDCLQSGVEDTRHFIFKLVRRLILGSHLSRVCLFGMGFFDVCLEILPTMVPENARYLAKTILRFIMLDPVFGQRGYQKFGHYLPSRTDILRLISSTNIPPNLYLRLSNFLKTGSTKRNATIIWNLLDVLLGLPDPETHLAALLSYSYLALSSMDTSLAVIGSTHAPEAARSFLDSGNPRLILATLFYLSSSTFEIYREGLVRLERVFGDLILVGLFYLEAEQKEIRVLAARLLNNLVAASDDEISTRVAVERWPLIVQKCLDDDFSVKNELVWLILNILLSVDFEQRLNALNEEVWSIFETFLEGGDNPLIEAILNFFCVMLNEDDENNFIEMYINTEIHDIVAEINDSKNPALVALSQFIMEVVDDYQNDE